MKRLKQYVAVAAVLVAAAATNTKAYAQDIMETILQRGELRIGVQTSGTPVSFVDKNGTRTGFAIELAEMMAKDLNVKLVIQDYDWKGLIPALLAAKFDMIAADMTPTPQRAAQVLFSQPIFYQDTIAYTRKDLPYTKWEDLNVAGLNVGGTQGGTYITSIKEFLPNATVKEFAAGPAVSQAVATGRIDAGVASLGNFSNISANYENIKLLDGFITREPLAFAMRKEDIHLKLWVDNYVSVIDASKKLDRLIDYWWTSEKWKKDHK